MASDLVALMALVSVLGAVLLVMAVTSARSRLRARPLDPLVPEHDPFAPRHATRTRLPRALAASSMFTAPRK